MTQPDPKGGTGDVWMEVIRACDRWVPGFDSVEWGAYWYWIMFGPIDGEAQMVDEILEGAPDGLQKDMLRRRWVGILRYEQPLRRGDGRDHNLDAYEEALDLVVYLWAARAPWALRWLAVGVAAWCRRRL